MLQGCLLGPILLSLLSVFYNLHADFMGGGQEGGETGEGALVRSKVGGGRHNPPPRVIISSPARVSLDASPARQSASSWAKQHGSQQMSPLLFTSPDAAGAAASPSGKSAAVRDTPAVPLKAWVGDGDRGSQPEDSHAQQQQLKLSGCLMEERMRERETEAGVGCSRAPEADITDVQDQQQSISLSLGGMGSRQSMQSSRGKAGSESTCDQNMEEVAESQPQLSCGAVYSGGHTVKVQQPQQRQLQQSESRLQHGFSALQDLDDFSFGKNDYSGL